VDTGIILAPAERRGIWHNKPVRAVHSVNSKNSINDQPSAVRQRVSSVWASGSDKRKCKPRAFGGGCLFSIFPKH